jgi:hypothetical protein
MDCIKIGQENLDNLFYLNHHIHFESFFKENIFTGEIWAVSETDCRYFIFRESNFIIDSCIPNFI